MDSYGKSSAAKAGPAIFRSGYTNTNITLDVVPVVVEGRTVDAGSDTTKVDDMQHEPISNISKKAPYRKRLTFDEAKSLFINFGGADSQTGVGGQLSAIFERMVHDDGCIDEEEFLKVFSSNDDPNLLPPKASSPRSPRKMVSPSTSRDTGSSQREEKVAGGNIDIKRRKRREALALHELRTRLGADLYDDLKAGFDRLTTYRQDFGTNSYVNARERDRILKKDDFVNDVLGELLPTMPSFLKENMFRAFDRNQSGGLSLVEFLDGMCYLLEGDRTERLELVFDICDVSENGRVTAKEFETFLAIVDENAPVMKDFVKSRANSSIDNEEALLEAENGQVVQELKRRDERLFASVEKSLEGIDLEEFLTWAKGHVDHDLITWLQDVGDRARFRSFEFGGKQHAPLDMSPFLDSAERRTASGFGKQLPGFGKSSQESLFRRQDSFPEEELLSPEALSEELIATLGSAVVSNLLRFYDRLTQHSSIERLDEDSFVSTLAAPETRVSVSSVSMLQQPPVSFVRRLFALLDHEQWGVLDKERFVRSAAKHCLVGTPEKKTLLLYNLYKRDTYVSQGSFREMLAAACTVSLKAFEILAETDDPASPYSSMSSPDETEGGGWDKDDDEQRLEKKLAAVSEAVFKQCADEHLNDHRLSPKSSARRRQLSEEEFSKWVLAHSDAIFPLAGVVPYFMYTPSDKGMGLRPSSNLIERDMLLSKLNARPQKYLEAYFVAGDRWFAISAHWFEQWCGYVGVEVNHQQDKEGVARGSEEWVPKPWLLEVDDEEREQQQGPAQIDNSDIVDRALSVEANRLKPNIMRGQHYYLVHEDEWQFLNSWYGCDVCIEASVLDETTFLRPKAEKLVIPGLPSSDIAAAMDQESSSDVDDDDITDELQLKLANSPTKWQEGTGSLELELYPILVRGYKCNKMGKQALSQERVEFLASKADSIEVILGNLKAAMDIDVEARLWLDAAPLLGVEESPEKKWGGHAMPNELKGEQVLVRWKAGLGFKLYQGTVEEVIDRKITVQYDDGDRKSYTFDEFENEKVYFMTSEYRELQSSGIQVDPSSYDQIEQYLTAYGANYVPQEPEPIDQWVLIDEAAADIINLDASLSQETSKQTNISEKKVVIRLNDLDVAGALQLKVLVETEVISGTYSRKKVWPRAALVPVQKTATDAKGNVLRAAVQGVVPDFVTLRPPLSRNRFFSSGTFMTFAPSCATTAVSSVKQQPSRINDDRHGAEEEDQEDDIVETHVQPGEIGRVVMIDGAGLILVKWRLGYKKFRGEELDLFPSNSHNQKVYWNTSDRDIPKGSPLQVEGTPRFNERNDIVLRCKHRPLSYKGSYGSWTFSISSLSTVPPESRKSESEKQNTSDDKCNQNSAALTSSAKAGRSIFGSGQAKPNQVGLSNLGNTCYMNASIQALSHVILLRGVFIKSKRVEQHYSNQIFPTYLTKCDITFDFLTVTDYFLCSAYLFDINDTSKFGTGGKVAHALAKLMRALDDAKISCVAPRDFKNCIGCYDATFRGYEQQDAHEFISKVLEGLGDDLNRVPIKKYIADNSENEGRQEDEVASEYWWRHTSRENHIVTALFTGMICKSKRCNDPRSAGVPEVTFESSSMLSLDLPEASCISVNVTVVFRGNRPWPTRLALSCHREISLRELMGTVSETINRSTLEDDEKGTSAPAPSQTILATELVPALVDKACVSLKLDQKLDEHLTNLTLGNGVELYLFQVPDTRSLMVQRNAGSPSTSPPCHSNASDGSCVVSILMRKLERADRFFLQDSRIVVCGRPFLVRVTPGVTTAADLYETVWREIRSLFSWSPPSASSTDKASECTSERAGPYRKHYLFHLNRCSRDGHVPVLSNLHSGDELFLNPMDASTPLANIRDNETFAVDIRQAAMPYFSEKTACFVRDHDSVAGVAVDRLKPTPLLDILENFTRPEDVMSYSRELTRANGGEYTEAIHRIETSIYAGPPVLIVALKRFKETATGRRTKITTLVDFPVKGLDLRPYIKVPVDPAFGRDNGFAPYKPVSIDLADLIKNEDNAGDRTDDDDDNDDESTHEHYRKAADGNVLSKDGANTTNRLSRDEIQEGVAHSSWFPFYRWRNSKRRNIKKNSTQGHKSDKEECMSDSNNDVEEDGDSKYNNEIENGKVKTHDMPTSRSHHEETHRLEKRERQKMERQKQEGMEQLPDLPRLPRGSPIYDLTAIVNHHGTLDGGHYTACALDRGSWFKFDDHRVRPIDAARGELVTKDAYILIYTHRDAAELHGGGDGGTGKRISRSFEALFPSRSTARPVKPDDIEAKKWKKRFQPQAPPVPSSRAQQFYKNGIVSYSDKKRNEEIYDRDHSGWSNGGWGYSVMRALGYAFETEEQRQRSRQRRRNKREREQKFRAQNRGR